MKIFIKPFLLLAAFFACTEIFAQVSINAGGALPDHNAMLDVSSSTKGVLLPRMSTVQRTAISNPKTGLLVFDSTSATFWYAQSGIWRELSTGSTSSDSLFIYGQQSGVLNSYNMGTTAIYQDSSGYLYDSGGPTGNYSNNETDTVVIYPNLPNMVGLRVQIQSCNLENFYDSLLILDGLGHTYSFTGTQTGTLILPTYAYIIFKSNNIVTAPGFKIRWDAMFRPTGPDSPPFSGWYYIPQDVAVKGGLNIANQWSKDSTGFLSFDWGQGNAVKGTGATSFGLNNIVSGNYGTAAGQFNSVTGNFAAALNQNNISSGLASFTTGNKNIASGDYSSAFGQSSIATGKYSFAFGNRDSALLINDFALGAGCTAKGGSSFAAGLNSFATGSAAVAIGNNCYAAGKDAFAVNHGTYALGKYSLTAGYFSEADGDYAIAMGNEAYAKANHSLALGYYAESDGTYSTALGYYANSIGAYSLASGAISVSAGSISSAFGLGTITKGYASTGVGEYNDTLLTANQITVTAATPLFTVGNGDNATTRSNAMVVLKNGNTGIGNIIPQQNLSVNAGMNIDQSSANSGTISNTLTFGGTSGEGIGSKRTAGGNSSGLDFYTANTQRLSITNTGNVAVGNITPQQNLSVNAGMDIDQASANNGTISNTLTFGGSSGEGIGSKRTATGNNNGLDFYTASAPRMSISNGGNVGIGITSASQRLEVNGNAAVDGNLTVGAANYGIIRNSAAAQMKMVSTNVTVNPGTMTAGATTILNVTFSQSFSTPPVVYVGNYNGTGGWAEGVTTIGNVSATGCVLYFFNAKTTTASPNFNVNIIAIGTP